MSKIKLAGQTALETALKAWNEIIIEPSRKGTEVRGAAAIDGFIRKPTGLNWAWSPVFDEGSDYEWCGAFAAFAWASAGLALDLRQLYFSSTSRLAAYAKYQALFNNENERLVMAKYPKPKVVADRRISVTLDEHSTPDSLGDVVPQAGDILLVGYPGSRMGTHVTIVSSFDEHGFHTVEGNARGSWADCVARTAQGVTRNIRPLGLSRGQTGYHARRLIRPSPLDLVETPS